MLKGLAQILEKRYPDPVAAYQGEILLAVISYHKKTKEHAIF